MTPPKLNHSTSSVRRGGLIEAALPKLKQRALQNSIGRWRPSPLPRLRFESRTELGVDVRKIAGMDAGGAGGGHEIGVVGPAGNDVDMEMFGNAGPGRTAQV